MQSIHKVVLTLKKGKLHVLCPGVLRAWRLSYCRLRGRSERQELADSLYSTDWTSRSYQSQHPGLCWPDTWSSSTVLRSWPGEVPGKIYEVSGGWAGEGSGVCRQWKICPAVLILTTPSPAGHPALPCTAQQLCFSASLLRNRGDTQRGKQKQKQMALNSNIFRDRKDLYHTNGYFY